MFKKVIQLYIGVCVCVCAHSHSVMSDSCDPMDCSPPGSSVHGILQARILEWVLISSSRGSSRPRDQTPVSCTSCIDRCILYYCTYKAIRLSLAHEMWAEDTCHFWVGGWRVNTSWPKSFPPDVVIMEAWVKRESLSAWVPEWLRYICSVPCYPYRHIDEWQ